MRRIAVFLATLALLATACNDGPVTDEPVTSGPATQLAFTVQPSATTAGMLSFIFPAVEVTALDEFGNTATGFAGDVTVEIGTNAHGGALTGTSTRAAVDGVATFDALQNDWESPAGCGAQESCPTDPGCRGTGSVRAGRCHRSIGVAGCKIS
jgi:hypothetical protein